MDQAVFFAKDAVPTLTMSTIICIPVRKRDRRGITQLLFIMNLIAVFLLVGCLHLSAASYSQTITLHEKSYSLKAIFNAIQKQTDYSVIYNVRFIETAKPIAVSAKQMPLEELLSEALNDQSLTYEIREKTIIIGRTKENAAVDAKQDRVTVAQQLEVSGRVTDESGSPLEGVSVLIKGTNIGVSTNADGRYTLRDVPAYSVLVFTMVSFATAEVAIENRGVIDVVLQSESSEMDEVVVVGYGKQKKESVIGAISTVQPKQLKLPAAHVSNVLAGQIGGVVSIQRSGEPGQHGNFWIRGLSTNKSSNRPLVLIDGIERGLDFVDIEDIATISVLKDATATAVYGVKGANGVVLITTRTGDEGAAKVSVNAFGSMVSPTKMPEFVNSYQFATYYNEGTGRKSYDDFTLEQYLTGADPDLYPDVDWIGALFKDFSSNRKTNVNVSGGGNVGRYYISAGYFGENGIYKTDNMKNYNSSLDYSKFNFRSNLDVDLTKTTVVSINLSNIYETKTIPGGAGDAIWNNAFTISPNAFPVRYSDGTFSSPPRGAAANASNPYNLLTQSGYRDHYWNTSQAILGIRQDLKFITDGLKFNIRFAWDSWSYSRMSYLGSANTFNALGRDEDGNLIFEELNAGSANLSYERETGGNRAHYLESNLDWNGVFNDVHNLSFMLLYNQKSYRNLWADNGEGSVPFRNQGIAGRMTYNFAGRYFTEVNFGYNGSENFSPGKRFGFFPSAAVGWMVSEEKFFEPIRDVVNVFKIRSSYGLVGNDDIGGGRRFIYNPTFNMKAPGFTFGLPGSQVTNDNGIRVAETANDQVSWEKVAKFNLGLELSLFHGLELQADYFTEHRKGIFLERNDMSQTAGVVAAIPWVNVGEVKNKGFELQGEYLKTFTSDFSVSLRGNFIFARNILINDAAPKWNYAYRDRKGRPVGQQYGYIAEGLFSSEEEIENSPKPFDQGIRVGDIKYRDINGDGLINNFDEVAIGHSWMPEINYGIGASVMYKNVDLSFLFQGVGQVTTMFGGQAMQPFSGTGPAAAGFFLDVYENRWRPDNPDPNAKYPRASAIDNQNNGLASTFWQSDASYLRLRNATLGYTVNKDISSRWFMRQLRFYVSGYNLLTFSKIKLFDPEIENSQGAGYPPTRIISLGLNANF